MGNLHYLIFILLVLTNQIYSLPVQDGEIIHMEIPSSPVASPVIIIPGDGGSQAYASLNGGDPFIIWINFEYLIELSKLAYYFKLIYNNQTHKTSDVPYANISFPGFGDTQTIENLDTRIHDRTIYFSNFITKLKENSFYKSNYTVRGAPYDFRRAPNENDAFFTNMKHLVEETFENAGNHRVMILGHSLGNLYSISFLKRMSKAWKKKYIRGFISVSPPLAGSVKAMKLEASGDNLGSFIISSLKFRGTQRTFPSSAFLMPNPQYFSADFPIIITDKKNYSSHNYEEFFEDMGFYEGYLMRQDTEHLIDPVKDIADVDELYCLYGNQIDTPLQLVYPKPTFYRSGFPDGKPSVIYGDGDGTVNIRSLEVCKQWPKVKVKVFPKAEHMDIVREATVIDYIIDILSKGG